jgi:hypothetical protein
MPEQPKRGAARKHGLRRRDPPPIIPPEALDGLPALEVQAGQLAADALWVADALHLHPAAADLPAAPALIGTYAALSRDFGRLAAEIRSRAIRPAALGNLDPDSYAALIRSERQLLAILLSRAAYAVGYLRAEGVLDEDGNGITALRQLAAVLRAARRMLAGHSAALAWGERRTDTGEAMAERLMAAIAPPERD